jgi:hypothetical protein
LNWERLNVPELVSAAPSTSEWLLPVAVAWLAACTLSSIASTPWLSKAPAAKAEPALQ